MGIVATLNFLLFFVLRVIVYGYMVYKWWFLYLSEKSFVVPLENCTMFSTLLIEMFLLFTGNVNKWMIIAIVQNE